MKKILSIFLFLILISTLLISCGEQNKDSEGNGTITLKKVENLSEYVIVRSDTSSSEVTFLTSSLRKAINDATGASVSVKTDYTNNTYEILVGMTSRKQSEDASAGLKLNDYTIKKDGNKIVIAAGSEKALRKAVELFKAEFIDAEKKIVKIPSGNGYTFRDSYKYENIKVEGVDITEFKVYNNSLIDLEAEGVLDELRNAFGVEFMLVEKMISDEHYIVIDGTELVAHKYGISVENGNLIIRGSAHSLSLAIEEFLGGFIDGLGADGCDILAANGVEKSTGKKEIYSKDQMMSVIKKVYEDPDRLIIGGQTNGGKHPDVIADTISIFKESSGEMPGIIGIDLACYGIDLTRTDDVLWSSFICDLVDYASGGGLITASAHWANPSKTNDDRVRGNFGTENTLEAYQKNFTDLLTEGTEYNAFFKNELEINARFLKALEENGVPIIWRPLHEANGNWFWFCTRQQNIILEPSYLINVWHYIYEYFNDECGLTNLIWCYGPNYSPNVDNSDPNSTLSASYLYPGDEYCDMIGVDWYTHGDIELMKNENYLRFTEEFDKPSAITEFGPTGNILGETLAEQPGLYNSMDLYGNLYEMMREGYSFTYLLTWTTKWSIPTMGRADEFMQTDMTLGQAEVKAMLDAVK